MSIPKDAEALRFARESRANEALKMKDEQIRILTEQNNSLLASLDQVEQEANGIQVRNPPRRGDELRVLPA
eukprot:316076-Prorocentrum_lima.AAC.1